MSETAIPYPKPTAQVEQYVAVLGYPLAIRFLLTFGGAELSIAREPKSRSRLTQLVGKEKARELAQCDHLLQRRVPLAKKWLAECLLSEGYGIADIARILRVSDVSVRKMLPAELRAKARARS